MYKDERDVLDVLKAELAFLEKGGYGRSPRESWRQPIIFEDSPSCMNYDSKQSPGPCSDCILMQLVPPQFRGRQIPCRHIPFNAGGETLDSLYRDSDQFEVEEVFGKWLRKTIAALEEARQFSHAEGTRPSAPGVAEAAGESLSQKLHPKCANPCCTTAFRWLAGGKFFRFRPERVAAHSEDKGAPSLLGFSGVEHFWLCDRCSHIFTLGFEENEGVILKLLYPALLAAEHPNPLTACGPDAK
jgi:hypothetical protein